jgi:hypothetical protein
MKKHNITTKEQENPRDKMKNQKVLVKVQVSLQDNGREITDYSAHLDKQTFLKQCFTYQL